MADGTPQRKFCLPTTPHRPGAGRVGGAMATTDEIVDNLSGFALFADLGSAQLQQVAHTFEERWFPEGERILRQGLTGSGFFVILDGEVGIVVDGEQRTTLGRGDFFGEVSIL